MDIGISLTSTDNVLADFAWIQFQFYFRCVVHCAGIKLIFCLLRFPVFFVSRFIVMLQGNSDKQWWRFTLDCAFRPTSDCRTLVNFPPSNWFAVDRVFLMFFVSSFVMSVEISLTNSYNILQLNVHAFRFTSDNIVSVNVSDSDWFCVVWVVLVIFVSSFVVFKRIALTINNNVLADYAWIRFISVSSGWFNVPASKWFTVDCVFQLFLFLDSLWCSKESLWQSLMTFCWWLSLHFVPFSL